MAGHFSVRLADQRANTNGEQELRLLTQPLYRYPAGEEEVLDGALFAIVLGTDPEVFLLLEARGAAEKLSWQYGLARMNIDPMTGSYTQQEVWRVEKTAPWTGPIDKPYHVEILRK